MRTLEPGGPVIRASAAVTSSPRAEAPPIRTIVSPTATPALCAGPGSRPVTTSPAADGNTATPIPEKREADSRRTSR